MKKQIWIFSVVIAVVFMLSQTFVFAEGNEGKGDAGKMKMNLQEMAKKQQERIEQKIVQLTKDLNLTPDQQAQLRNMMTATGEKIKKMMQDTRENIKKLMDKDREGIKAMLTDVQKAILEQKRQQGKDKEEKGEEQRVPESVPQQ